MTTVGLLPSDVAAPEVRLVGVARQRGMGVFLLLLAIIMLLGFGLGVPASDRATFILTAPPAVKVAPLVMSVRLISIVLAACCAAVGVLLLVRRRSRGTYLFFSLGVLLFLWSFLAWAARGATLNFVEMLAATLISTTPLVFGSR